MAGGRNICILENCNAYTHSRQLCRRHYKQAEKGKIPMPEKGRVRGVCSIPECGKPHFIKGYCQMHMARWRRHGDPLFTKTSPEGAGLALLESLVGHRGDACIEWPFSRNRHGYGQTYYCGEVMGAHRVMCILDHGEPPSPSHHAAHSCGKGKDACINPSHLRWATAQENIDDKFSRHGWSLERSEDGRIIGHVQIASPPI